MPTHLDRKLVAVSLKDGEEKQDDACLSSSPCSAHLCYFEEHIEMQKYAELSFHKAPDQHLTL